MQSSEEKGLDTSQPAVGLSTSTLLPTEASSECSKKLLSGQLTYSQAIQDSHLEEQDFAVLPLGRPALHNPEDRFYSKEEVLFFASLKSSFETALKSEEIPAGTEIKAEDSREYIDSLVPSTSRKRLSSAEGAQSSARKSTRLDAQKARKAATEHWETLGLSEADLQWLGRPALSEPYARVYNDQELLKLAAIKEGFQNSKQDEINQQREVEREMRLKRQAQIDAESQEWNVAMKQWHIDLLEEIQHSHISTLPLDIWERILKSLCDDIELYGVRAPSVIARDISNASIVNKEIYAASLPAFKHLSSLCSPLKNMIRLLSNEHYSRKASCKTVAEDHLWDSLISDPSLLRMTDLKTMRQNLRLPGFEKKAMTIFQLVERMGLKHPTPVPARLVLAVREEKSQKPPVDLNSASYCAGYHDHYYRTTNEKSAFQLRSECISRGTSTMGALKAASLRDLPSSYQAGYSYTYRGYERRWMLCESVVSTSNYQDIAASLTCFKLSRGIVCCICLLSQPSMKKVLAMIWPDKSVLLNFPWRDEQLVF